MFLSTTSAPWFWHSMHALCVIDSGFYRFCTQSLLLVLPLSGPLCCYSVQPFSATGWISWHQPLPQFSKARSYKGPCRPIIFPLFFPNCFLLPKVFIYHLVSRGQLLMYSLTSSVSSWLVALMLTALPPPPCSLKSIPVVMSLASLPLASLLYHGAYCHTWYSYHTCFSIVLFSLGGGCSEATLSQQQRSNTFINDTH